MMTELDFTLEPWRMDFAADMASHASNEKIAGNLRNTFPHPYTLKDAEDYVTLCMQDERAYTRAIVVGGQAAGSIGVFFKDDVSCKSGELGYWLGEPFWNHHIISRAIMMVCDEVFGAHDIVRIYAEPYAHNVGSRKALERAGFSLEGVLRRSVYKNGGLYDSCIYALLRNDDGDKISKR